MALVEITRLDWSVARLRAEAARTADAKQARRMLAIAMVLDGHARRLAEVQRSEVAKWVEDGPGRKTGGVVRWRRADPRDRIAAKFNVHPHAHGAGKLLHALDFSSIPGCPLHPRSGLEAREAFKKTSPGWQAPRSRRGLPAGRLESGFRCYEGGQLAPCGGPNQKRRSPLACKFHRPWTLIRLVIQIQCGSGTVLPPAPRH
jgi:hypothetical protein